MYHPTTRLALSVSTLLSLYQLSSAQLSNITTPSLNLTAIATSNGSSVLECWQFPDFASTTQAGTVGSLNLYFGNTANLTYTVIPARFNGGAHRAPAAQ